jgi:hypothetical protein
MRGRPALLLAGVLLVARPAAALAQGIEPGWAFTSELNVVVSEGNSESLTLGLGAKADHGWTATAFRIELKGVRSEASRKTRAAVGTANDFEIVETKVREKTAEALNVTARLDRNLGDRIFTFAGLDWLRNTFAGVDGRYLMALGGGSTLIDQETTRLKADLAGTYTFQNDVVTNPFVKNSFPGLRSGILFWKRISSSAETESQLVTDWNVQDTEDLRLDWTNSIAVSVISVVALKPSLQLLWRNQPSLTTVGLFGSDGTPTTEFVTVPLEKLDLFFRVALVVTL